MELKNYLDNTPHRFYATIDVIGKLKQNPNATSILLLDVVDDFGNYLIDHRWVKRNVKVLSQYPKGTVVCFSATVQKYFSKKHHKPKYGFDGIIMAYKPDELETNLYRERVKNGKNV